jgi:diketogulonate reductase-like aldo/keto reductase
LALVHDEPSERPMRPIPRVKLPDGAQVPALGLGTWRMGESRRAAEREAAALALGLELGMTLIDTAEMYGNGGAEEVVARAIGAGHHGETFVVSKLYPHNAGRKAMRAACAKSLQRLRVERLDLYLLHWRGRVPLAETVDAFESLRREGKIARWGVSNFDVDDMRELWALSGGRECATNQVLYHLGDRGIEWDLLPWMRERQMPVMAYCPLGEGRLLAERRLAAVAAQLGATPAQVALAWLARQGDVIAIPQSTNPAHVRANRAATDRTLDAAALAALDAAFPGPTGPRRLSVV